MEPKIIVKINDPETGQYYSVAEWKARASDPTIATLISICTFQNSFVISKDMLPGKYNFDRAQKAASEFKVERHNSFHCPNRSECLDIYDARSYGLDEALALIGGRPLVEERPFLIWTSDADHDTLSNPDYAFAFDGFTGNIRNRFKHHKFFVRPVSELIVE